MNCMNCKHRGCIMRGTVHESPNCDTFEAITNGDRIRSMPNNELAAFLDHHVCPDGVAHTDRCKNGALTGECEKCWLEWLGLEVEE